MRRLSSYCDISVTTIFICVCIYIYIHTHTILPPDPWKLDPTVKYRNLITVHLMKLTSSSFKYRFLKSLSLEKLKRINAVSYLSFSFVNTIFCFFDKKNWIILWHNRQEVSCNWYIISNMHSLIPKFSLKLNWTVNKEFIDNNCSFLNNIKCFQTNFIRQLLEKTTNRISHFIYPICMVQELLVLIVVLQFQSIYHLLIWIHPTEWNVVVPL